MPINRTLFPYALTIWFPDVEYYPNFCVELGFLVDGFNDGAIGDLVVGFNDGLSVDFLVDSNCVLTVGFDVGLKDGFLDGDRIKDTLCCSSSDISDKENKQQ